MADSGMSAVFRIRALGMVGVDFSVPESDLTDWLNDPDFTPYPAISQSLLALLAGHRLSRAVFIDVIVFNYEHAPGVTSPRKVEQVNSGVLKKSVLDGFNERYGAAVPDFDGLLTPQGGPQPQPPGQTPVGTPAPPPVLLAGLVVEGATKTQNGTILVDTDNPLVTSTVKLITVHADWANGMVPQELNRQQLQWQFNNGDAVFSVGGGEADAQPHPVRAGSLNDTTYAFPNVEGSASGATSAQVDLAGRIRVGYKPVTVHLLISGPKAFASNTGQPFSVALDPDVLLVPVEVARFFAPDLSTETNMQDQMALWDQVPIINATANTKSIDSGSGELKLTARAWDSWPQLTPEGVYRQSSWISPDSVWGKAKVRFRLVNYIDIQTDHDHVNPTQAGLEDSSALRQNFTALSDHPQHISDKPVLVAIFMFRLGPPGDPEIGRALLGENVLGVPAGVSQRDAVIAHEIGHLILDTDAHADLPNNVLNSPGPGTDVSPVQIDRARSWAEFFADFWQH